MRGRRYGLQVTQAGQLQNADILHVRGDDGQDYYGFVVVKEKFSWLKGENYNSYRVYFVSQNLENYFVEMARQQIGVTHAKPDKSFFANNQVSRLEVDYSSIVDSYVNRQNGPCQLLQNGFAYWDAMAERREDNTSREELAERVKEELALALERSIAGWLTIKMHEEYALESREYLNFRDVYNVAKKECALALLEVFAQRNDERQYAGQNLSVLFTDEDLANLRSDYVVESERARNTRFPLVRRDEEREEDILPMTADPELNNNGQADRDLWVR